MLALDFEYYKPDTMREAAGLFQKLNSDLKSPIYYAGGTEIISMARVDNIFTKAVIDIKGIPECNEFGFVENTLVIGAAITLTQIGESNFFPLLSKQCKRIADHTMQGKITIGGNVCSSIIYRSAVLPLLLAESQVVIAGKDGVRTEKLLNVFDKEIKISSGEFVVKFMLEKEYANLPYSHVKRTKFEKIDYPLITCAALKKDENIRIAFTGMCDFPFRSFEIEKVLNDNNISIEDKKNKMLENMPGPILSDISGSDEYRKFIFGYIVDDTLQRLGGQ